MKNKMKKIFSKITILVLLVAMLVPYTSIPKVEAATETECNGEWENHTNYYFFLQAEHPYTWAYGFVEKNSNNYDTNYYTSFLYNFPSDASKIQFDDDNSGFVRITNSTSWNNSFIPSGEKGETWTAAQFYYEYIKEGNGAAGDYQDYIYKNTQNNRTITYLYHGPWASAGNTNNGDIYNAQIDLNKTGKLNFKSGGVELDVSNSGIRSHIDKLVNATIFIDRDAATISHAKVGYGSQTGAGSEMDYSFAGIKEQIELYNEKKGAISSGSIKPNNGNPVISLLITRTYYASDIFDKTFAQALGASSSNNLTFKNDNGLKACNGTNCKSLYFPEDNNNTYSNTSITYGDSRENSSAASYQTSYKLSTTYNSSEVNWFFAPTLFKISYKVCKDAGSPEGKVTLSYDGNEEYVKSTDKADKVPSSEQKDKGSDFTIPKTKPELKGYTFQEWNTSPKCDGTEYEPDYTIENLENDTTLYACWGSTNGEKGPGTGVLTYTGLFAGIIALAGGSYYIMKKKNLFKQI